MSIHPKDYWIYGYWVAFAGACVYIGYEYFTAEPSVPEPEKPKPKVTINIVIYF